MPGAYAPTAQSTSTAQTVHADGDPGDAATFNAPLETLLDRALYARNALAGLLVSEGRLSVDTGGSVTVFVVRVGPIQSVCLPQTAGGTFNVFQQTTEKSLTVTDVEGAPGTLAADTWYYVYAYNNAGALAWQIATTAPDAGRIWKNGSTTHRYLGCFRTNTTYGGPLPLRAHRGRYVYQYSAAGAALRALALTAGAAPAALSLAAFAPSHSRIASLAVVTNDNGAGGVGTAEIRTTGDSTSTFTFAISDVQDLQFYVPDVTTDSSQRIDWETNSATRRLLIDVTGFVE